MRIINLHKEDELDSLLRMLRKTDLEGQERALRLISKRNKNLADGIKILNYTKKDFPESDFPWLDIPSRLIDIVVKKPYVGYIDKVKDIFDFVSFPAKVSILLFLSEFDHIKATETYIELLGRIHLDLRGLPIGTLASKPRHGALLFPQLLEFTDNKFLVKDIYYLLILYLDSGQTSDEAIRQMRPDLIKEILRVIDILLEKNRDFQTRDIWDDDDYIYLREFIDIHIILAAFIKDIRIINGLYKLMDLKDKFIKMYVITSLIGMECRVESKDFLDVAESDEARVRFHEALVSMGQADRFPKEYMNNDDFSRSVMVSWLINSSDFGRLPDDIQIAEKKIIDGGLYYMYKFRSKALELEERGWMIGITGPYYNNDYTTLRKYSVFSNFHSYNGKKLDLYFDLFFKYL